MSAMKTPGVYIVDKETYPNAVIEAATAIPAFIGYTEKASEKDQSLLNKPVRISSINEFIAYFGGAPKPKFDIKKGDGDFNASLNGESYTLTRTDSYILYYCMLPFYANGGSDCYIVSVGNYTNKIEYSALAAGIAPLVKEQEPTMLVIPEAVCLAKAEDCYVLQQAMANHCGFYMKNRIAIFDIYEGYKNRKDPNGDVVTKFRENIGVNFLSFCAAYYPWINFNIIQEKDLDYSNLDLKELIPLITQEIEVSSKKQATKEGDLKKEEILKLIQKIKENEEKIEAEIASGKDIHDQEQIRKENHRTLLNCSPFYKEVMRQILLSLNRLPAAPSIAGIITLVDNTSEVWKAPANINLASAISSTQNVSNEEQEDLNIPLDGKSVNTIRVFPGEGIKVWGARTLDSNSMDWKYINVRRTMIMLEESIKNATKAYIFEPNMGNTWISVKSMISNFLYEIWKRGGLIGSTPDDAYSVHIGLGETMTPTDILEGIMRITVLVAIVHPGVFAEITFEIQMQNS